MSLAAELPFAALVSLPIALIALLVGAVSRSGALAGFLVATVILAGVGWSGWAQLGVTLVTTVAVTRAGLARKNELGLAESGNGARGWRNVAANTGLAACASLFAHDSTVRDAACLIVATVLTTGAADSTASEIGQAWGGRAHLLFPRRAAPAGTSGAMTVVGTVAGGIAAVALAGMAGAAHLISPAAMPVVAGSAFVALVLESFVSRSLEARGWLDNNGVNLLATAVGSGLALGVAFVLRLI